MKSKDYIIKVKNLRVLGFYEGFSWSLSFASLMAGTASSIKGNFEGALLGLFGSIMLMLQYRLVRMFLNEKQEELENEGN